ncbi:MAG: alpha-amylase family glycosyl hydrolase [Pseudomonadales bacterium]
MTSNNRTNMDKNTQTRLTELLEVLYEPSVAAATLPRLIATLAAPIAHEPRNDSMLVCYGDSVCSEDQAPLETLHQFIGKYLGDACGRVHLLPFFPSSSDDGFAVIDYRMVDHHLGGWDDIAALARDYDLMFDLVINHCSRENLWFADFINHREPGRNFFITLPEEVDTSMVARPRSTPLISPVHTYGGIRHVWNTFSADQIDLDFTNPDVLVEFVDILSFYAARGARLVRLDAVGYLWKRLGTTCLNLPETHVVVKILRVLAEQLCPSLRLITETNVPHEENVAYFGDGDEAHLVYQFSLAPLLLYSFVFGDGSYLRQWAAQLDEPPEGTTYLNFIASHDGIGLRPLEGLMPEAEVDRLVDKMHARGGFVTLREVSAHEQKPYEINISLLSAFGGEPGLGAFLAAHALLLSFQGSPALYIHSMLGTLNDLDLVEQTGRTRSINRRKWQLSELEAHLQAPESLQARTLAGMTHLLTQRNAQPALQATAEQRILPAPEGVFLLQRECREQSLLVVCSLMDQPQILPADMLQLTAGIYVDRLHEQFIAITTGLPLQPHQVMWLELPAGA